MKRIIPFIAAILISSSGCVSATATVDNICSQKAITIPATPPELSSFVGLRTISKSFDEDFSDTLSKITDIADVSLNSIQLDISGNVGFIKNIKVALHSDNYPNDLLLSNTTYLTVRGSTINVPVTADKGQLLTALKSGKVVMTVSITGFIPVGETALDNNFCIGITAEASKSLF